jgi:predicted trehalose synthase
MSFQQALQHGDGGGGDKVVAQQHQQIDGVEIPRKRKAMGEVVARVHGDLPLATVRTQKHESAVACFRGWT